MIETVLLAFIIARLKGYRLMPFLREYAVWPFILLTAVYLYLPFLNFKGDISLVRFSRYFMLGYFVSVILFAVRFKTYFEMIIASLMMFAGTAMNNLAIWANGNRMPVFASISLATGFIKNKNDLLLDGVHTIGTPDTKLKFLTDFIDIGYCVLSIGDIFIKAFVFFIVFYSIKKACNGEGLKLPGVIRKFYTH